MIVASEDGVLAPFNAAGVLTASDIHVARRVAGLSGASVDDDVLIATALAVRAVRTGSTCVQLDRIGETAADRADEHAGALPWPPVNRMVRALTTSELVTGSPAGPLRPLALAESDDGPLLYLRKYFRQEQSVRQILDARAAGRPVVAADAVSTAIEASFGNAGGTEYDRQRAAAALAATNWTTVLAGGPGTGKTYTVARILAMMEHLLGEDVRIGLCAPTGRAAAQLQTVIGEYSRGHRRLHSDPRAVTVHRLLGSRPDGTFVRGAGNRLPFDVVVVDETSMLPVTMMCRLLESLRSDTRLILVGDPHQLVSVEAGAVLADLVDRAAVGRSAGDGEVSGLSPAFEVAAAIGEGDFIDGERAALAQGVITLRRGHRFGNRIGDVAEAVNAGDADRVLELVAGDGADPTVTLVDPGELDSVRDSVVGWAHDLAESAGSGDAGGAVASLRSHRVLCAHRNGRFGVAGWSRRVLGWIAEDLGPRPADGAWYAGEPLLVTANDRAQEVYNGDSGVVIAEDGALVAVFERGDQVKRLHPSQLGDVVPVYAMTIHRSQGSQFSEVTVILPPADAELLTRELLYTAITRARDRVRIVGTPDALRAAVGRRVARASGLRTRLREVGAQS